MDHKSKVICTVTGIRPDFIRMSEVFRKLDDTFTHIMIHTGQHYDHMLSDVFFEDLSIRKPDYNLQIGAEGREHYDQQALLGPAIIKCLQENDIEPEIILFLGDANTSLASVPLKKQGYCIGHIEAGMRSGDEWMPEEINRKACDHVSNLLFAYHDDYVKNLTEEGIDSSRIINVGNTITEVLGKYADYSRKLKKEFIFVDIHRHENVISMEKMISILKFCDSVGTFFDLPVKILQMPRTVHMIDTMKLIKLDFDISKIETIPLMSYRTYIEAVQDSKVLISDSGTAQEEGPLLGVPVIVPRTSTERPQAITNGSSRMFHYRKGIEHPFTFIEHYDSSTINNEWLGSGSASEKIIKALKKWCGVKND